MISMRIVQESGFKRTLVAPCADWMFISSKSSVRDYARGICYFDGKIMRVLVGN
jgi:hypothetical protein